MAIKRTRNGFKLTGRHAREYVDALGVKLAPQWVDAGSLDNGRCSYMRGSFRGPCCRLPAGHTGPHLADGESVGAHPTSAEPK